MNSKLRNYFRPLALMLLLLSGAALAKTDVVIFKNGDRLTGEIKSLERGRLRFKTAATDTIDIEWDEVAFLSSDQNIQVETVLGQRFLGHLVSTEDKNKLVVQSSAGPIDLNNIQVIRMTPIEERGINRIDGDITLGYSFTKANEVEQLNVGLELEFRTEIRRLSMDLDTVLTDSLDNDPSQRESLVFDYTRLLRNRWLAGGTLSATRNDELDIDLRTSLGANGGRIMRQTDHSSLILEGGLQATKEELAGNTADQNTLEGVFTARWDWYRYDTPELDLSTTFQLIPNLTDTGRVRRELDIELKWEMISDLFWQLSLYHSYDNRPPTEGAEKSDYAIVTSVGYDF